MNVLYRQWVWQACLLCFAIILPVPGMALEPLSPQSLIVIDPIHTAGSEASFVLPLQEEGELISPLLKPWYKKKWIWAFLGTAIMGVGVAEKTRDKGTTTVIAE